MDSEARPRARGNAASAYTDDGSGTAFSLPEGFAGSVGKVVEVRLSNFLNHESLVVHCSPYVNMIFGMNGQGKSAIVQGMALCFGGYGRSAGRDTILSRYIKDFHLVDGPSHAIVELVISNHGENAYKPELYGDAITLTRKIGRNNSGYYITGNRCKKSTIVKKELKNYLRHIEMNIGSPTTYMDQESSKEFFSQYNPNTFYKYYFSAAGLVEMEEKLNKEKRNLEDCKAEIKVRKKVLQPDKEKIQELVKQIKLFEEKLAEWNSAKEKYRLSLYRTAKEHYEALKETYDRFSKNNPQDEIVQLNESITLYTAEYDDTNEELQCLTASTATEKERIAATTDQISGIVDSINDKRSCIAAKMASVSQVLAAMENMDRDIANMESEPADVEKIRLEEELEVCKTEYDEKDKQQRSIQSAITDLEYNVSEMEIQLNSLRAELTDQRRENAEMERGPVSRLRENTIRTSLYRYDVDKVREDIYHMKKDGYFEHEPIGPIGEHIVVSRDAPSWKIMAVVERHLKNVLHTWLVATENDRRALYNLLLKHGCSRNRAKVIKSNVFSRPDLVERMDEEYGKDVHSHSILRYLSVTEMPPILLYVLADTCNIAKAVICNDDDRMYEVLTEDGSDISVAYSLAKLNSGRRLNGSLHFSPCYDKQPFTYEYVRVSRDRCQEFTQRHEERKGSALEREHSLVTLIASLTRELSEAKRRLDEQRNDMKSITTEKINVIRKRTRLEADLREEVNHIETMNHSSKFIKYCEAMKEIRMDYRKQLRGLRTELSELERDISSLELDKTKREEEVEKANEDLKQILKSIGETKNDLKKMQRRINMQKTQVKALEKNMKDYHFKLEGYVNDMKDAEGKLRTLEEEMKADGLDYSSELPNKPPEEYLRIMNLSNDVLQRLADDTRNVEAHLVSLRQTHDTLERALHDKMERLTETTENYRLHKKNYANRCKRFEDCRAKVERRAKRMFKKTLEIVTGYDGNLVFNDVERTLEIQIHNRQQLYSRDHVATNLKTLSGGEQSTIQLSMLQSMASISYSPVHMFDEVDVYMDESTRVRNIESLVKFASNHRDRQFFLVTPHSELANHIKENYPLITKIFNVNKDA